MADENPSFKWVDELAKALKNVDGFENVTEKSLKKALKNVDLDDVADVTDAVSDLADDNTLAILDVQEQIDDTNLSLIEYANTMREIEFPFFQIQILQAY